jgi:hypothetical protein
MPNDLRQVQVEFTPDYRIIYQVKTPVYVVLVTLYSKLDQADISAEQIRRVVSEFEQRRAALASSRPPHPRDQLGRPGRKAAA